jgi:hypothetical protein
MLFHFMRMGTRCTTFTKLPEALSDGSSEKRAAVAEATLCTVASSFIPG